MGWLLIFILLVSADVEIVMIFFIVCCCLLLLADMGFSGHLTSLRWWFLHRWATLKMKAAELLFMVSWLIHYF
jgi:hypothetical protein